MPSKTLHILQRCYKSSKLFFKQQKIFFQFAYSVSSNVYDLWVSSFTGLVSGRRAAVVKTPARSLFMSCKTTFSLCVSALLSAISVWWIFLCNKTSYGIVAISE